MKEYWFARRFPLRDMRSGMAPIHWKGWAAGIVFLLAMLLGGAAFWWFGAHGSMVKGAALFVAVAAAATVGFIGVAHRMGDHVRTVADYREDRKRASGQ
jgi:predicted permease